MPGQPLWAAATSRACPAAWRPLPLAVGSACLRWARPHSSRSTPVPTGLSSRQLPCWPRACLPGSSCVSHALRTGAPLQPQVQPDLLSIQDAA